MSKVFSKGKKLFKSKILGKRMELILNTLDTFLIL